MRRLNMGCQLDKKPQDEGWVNIDCRPECEPDLVHDLVYPLPYEDNSVDEILAKDILEHLSWRKVPDVLKDWLRVLKPGGEIYIQTPDLAMIAHYILIGKLWTWKQISYWIYGEQNVKENGHMSGFTTPTLARLITEVGFRIKEANKGGTNIMLWAVKPQQPEE
ncbi:unnamed protein product [marine sediment metagenome]|uniref:Methyltransferase type 11 domain-containing protein n=1 Tax=marine sediment metagenome TaxID=412755 RepID=X1RMR7_9ZZZZ